MVKNFLIILIIFIFKNLHAYDSNIYLIKDIEIIIEDTQELLAREKALNEAFNLSFDILLKRILNEKNYAKLKYNREVDKVPFIKDYKIKNEEFFDSKYTVLIDVNFYEYKVSEYLENFNLNKSNLVSEDFLALPVFSEFNNLFLWERKNKWFTNLINEYDDDNLLNLYFPERNFLNNFVASPKEILTKDINKFSDILKKFDKNSGIIIFLKEEYDSYSETFNSNLVLTEFNKEGSREIQIEDSRLKNVSSKTSQRGLLAQYAIEELNRWWKERIKIPELSVKKKIITFTHKFVSLKESIKLEKILSESVFIDQISKIQFNKETTTYEIITQANIEKINLSLRPKNIFLKEIINSDKYRIETLF